jgi:hypothetical protein
MKKQTKAEKSAKRAVQDAARAVLATCRATGVAGYLSLVGIGVAFTRSRGTSGRLTIERRTPAELPAILTVCSELRNTVQRERRRDREVKAGDLVITDTGGLGKRGNGLGLFYRRKVLSQIGGLLPYGPRYMGSYLHDRPLGRRQQEFDSIVRDENNIGWPVVLRVRTPAGEDAPIVYAAVSPGYTPYDPDELAGDVAEICEGRGKSPFGADCRGYAVYRGERCKLHLVEQASHGHARATVTVTSADDTSEAVQIGGGLTLQTGVTLHARTTYARVVHRGRREKFAEELQRGIATAANSVVAFREQFADRTGWKLARSHAERLNVWEHLCRPEGRVGQAVEAFDQAVLAQALEDAYGYLLAHDKREDDGALHVADMCHAVALAGDSGLFTDEQGQALRLVASALFWTDRKTVEVYAGVRDPVARHEGNTAAALELQALVNDKKEAEAGDSEEDRERAELLAVLEDKKREDSGE